MSEKIGKCCLCPMLYDEYGHNPHPLNDAEDARCCAACNARHVTPCRIALSAANVTNPVPRDEIIRRYRCAAEARAYLAKTAEEAVYYVALGKCLKRDMAAKHGLGEEAVGAILSQVAVKLVDEIRAL